MVALVGLALTLAAVALVLSPFFRHVAAPLTDGPDLLSRLRELQALKRVTYETLQDVELDYHAGKISETDYREMTDRYTREAVHLVQRIQEIEAQFPHPSGRGPRS
jgi:hypothetical protein